MKAKQQKVRNENPKCNDYDDEGRCNQCGQFDCYECDWDGDMYVEKKTEPKVRKTYELHLQEADVPRFYEEDGKIRPNTQLIDKYAITRQTWQPVKAYQEIRDPDRRTYVVVPLTRVAKKDVAAFVKMRKKELSRDHDKYEYLDNCHFIVLKKPAGKCIDVGVCLRPSVTDICVEE
jgi:hypothetical protein